MAHQLAPSVNCSLDEIDLNALKVHHPIDEHLCYFFHSLLHYQFFPRRDQNWRYIYR